MEKWWRNGSTDSVNVKSFGRTSRIILEVKLVVLGKEKTRRKEMRKVVVFGIALFLLAGCVSRTAFYIGPLAAGVDSQAHEWKGINGDFNCDDNPPCRSSLTVGFVTVGSDVTLGGENKKSVGFSTHTELSD